LVAHVEGAEESSAGGGEQLLLNAGGEHGRATEKFGGGRRGNGENSVSALDGAAADIESGTIPGIDGESLHGNGRADDIDDCVLGADLVEVDGFGIAIVDSGFGLGEEFKSFYSKGLGHGADGSAGDDLANFGEAAMDVRRVIVRFGVRMPAVGTLRFVGVRVLVSVLHRTLRLEVERLIGDPMDEYVHFGGGDSCALDTNEYKLSVEAKGASDGLQLLLWDTGVYGCAEKHVATDSREAIQVGNTHYESVGRWPEDQI
jgi:hypothetical protein